MAMIRHFWLLFVLAREKIKIKKDPTAPRRLFDPVITAPFP